MSKDRKDTFDSIAVAVDRFAHRDDALLPPRRVDWVDLNEISTPYEGPLPEYHRLDSVESFKARLAELREQYRPWLRDLTPTDPKRRPRQSLKQFQFRYEEVEDRRDAERPRKGTGSWQEVSIPHYVGPATRWAAYYRTTFTLDKSLCAREQIWLCFRGVDYKCQVFLNGHYIGSHTGFFAPFEFDVTEQLHTDRDNTLLVRVENDAVLLGNDSWPEAGGTWTQGDKVYAATGLGWDEPGKGWHHCPPGAGIYQPVFLEVRSAVHIADVFARPDIDASKVELRLETFGTEFRDVPVSVRATVFPRNHTRGEARNYSFDVEPAGPSISEYRVSLPLDSFVLWEPTSPHLYTLRVELVDLKSGSVMDSRDVAFGMRKFHQDSESGADANGLKGRFYLNNQPLILRGANTMGHEQRAVFEGNRDQLIDDLLIAKMANLNFLRITQRPVQSEVYDACDALGMMVQTDLPLFGAVRRGVVEEVSRQAGEMEKLIRSHPSCIVVTFINEAMNADHPEVVKKSHRLINRAELLNLLESCRHMVHLYNPDRVVKEMDGDYDPPHRYGMPDRHCYCAWYGNHAVPIGKLHAGYLFNLPEGWLGGCGEYGSEGLDPLITMQSRYPSNWLPDELGGTWSPAVITMSQTASKQHQWFDEQDSMEDWIDASQRHQAWATRTLTNALRRRADRIASSAIHLLIDAYPAGWMKSLVSVDRIPKPAFFDYADALTPTALNLRCDRSAVWSGKPASVELWILNDTSVSFAKGELTVLYTVRCGQEELLSRRVDVSAGRLDATAAGVITFDAPGLTQRAKCVVSASLIKAHGDCLHQSEIRLDVFPAPPSLDGATVAVLGPPECGSARLAHLLECNVVGFDDVSTDPDLVLVERSAAWEESKQRVIDYLKRGGRAIFFQAPDTGWGLGDQVVARVANSAHHFVSRKSGHPAVRDLQPQDMFMWFDARAGFAAPIIDSFVHAPGLQPITLTGAEQENGSVKKVAASGELTIGKGKAIFDEVHALQVFEGEPRAFQYLSGLIRYLLSDRLGVESPDAAQPIERPKVSA